MQGNEKARSDVAASEQAKTGSDVSGASSILNHTTQEPSNQVKIAGLLPRGAENAISTRRLMEICGCRTVRQLQKEIERERAAGALILSATTGGYYLPADGDAGRAEIMRYERTLHNRAVNTLRTLKAARRKLRECYGQETMEVPDDV